VSGVKELARRKSNPSPAQPPPIRRVALQACEAWIAWLEEGADHCRTDVSKLLDAAAASYLRSQGFTKPPPKRVP
jgi:hypothetical protein